MTAEPRIQGGARRTRLAILASAAGLFVEWFDLMIFSHLSSTIAKLFFPQSNGSVALLETYVVFALGFLIRPLGGVLIGRWGDLHGRRQTLFYSVLLMSVPMLMTAMLPTYKDIGIAAPLLLCAARLLTGFSAGGEWTGTIVALVETTPSEKRGTTVNIGNLSSGLGALASSLTVSALALSLSPDAMLAWGWRIPFFIGGALALMTLGLRRYMQETPAYEALKESGTVSRQPLVETLRHDRVPLLRCLIMIGCGTLTYYMLVTFLPSYLNQTGIMDARKSAVFTTIVTASMALGPLAFGRIADRFGFRWILIFSLLAMAVLIWPLFICISSRLEVGVWVASGFFLLAKTAYTGTMLPIAAQSIPTARRFTGLALSYNVAVMAFGGTAPALCTALIVMKGAYAAAAYVAWWILLTAVVAWKRRDGATAPGGQG